MSTLHVTNGDSAGNTLEETTLGGTVLPWRDALHEGPVQALPRRELLSARARFLADCGWGRQEELRASLERRDRRVLEAFRSDRPVVLWFEHDLYDQLQLLEVLSLAQAEGAVPELIVVGSFPGKQSFGGLGELTAQELESLWPTRRRAGPATLRQAGLVWDAFREPEPGALASSATQDIAELPFLGAALRRLLEELPAPVDGLSGTERRSLQAVAAGRCTPSAAFDRTQRLEPAPFLGDTWFFRALSILGQGDARLVEAADGAPLPPPPPLGDGERFARAELRLTAAGEQVLRGEADRVELLGVDRWLGGTHVTAGHLWRWDPARLELVRPR